MSKFSYHAPGETARSKMAELRAQLQALYETISGMPPSRELSLAVTNLEQAAMWANKAAVLADPESKPE